MLAFSLVAVAAMPGVGAAASGAAACPVDGDPILLDLCKTASPDTVASNPLAGPTSFEAQPATGGTTKTASTGSGPSALAGTQSCTYYDTRYASGSGSGDAIYGYTTNLGSKASVHAHSAFPAVYQNRIAYVTMVVGHRLIWNGAPASVNGRVVMPWFEGGSISTATDTSFFATTNASGSMQIETGLLDETTGQEQTSIESTHLQSGQSSKNYSSSNTRTYAVTFEQGHTYRPYIKLAGSAQAQGTVFNPGLQADSLVDWMGGSNGAYLNYAQYQFDLPDGCTLTCG